MVESIGSTPIQGDRNVTRVTATTPVPVVATAADTGPATASATPQFGGIAKALASAAPVDLERVAQIKRAIANGTFPILPATIADRLLALRLEWNPNDKA